jgi:hypothetical protein
MTDRSIVARLMATWDWRMSIVLLVQASLWLAITVIKAAVQIIIHVCAVLIGFLCGFLLVKRLWRSHN